MKASKIACTFAILLLLGINGRIAQADQLKLANALLMLKDDNSPQAQLARDQLNIQGYIKTKAADFKHTFELLKKSGVDQSFNFAFK